MSARTDLCGGYRAIGIPTATSVPQLEIVSGMAISQQLIGNRLPDLAETYNAPFTAETPYSNRGKLVSGV
jgi:hypothetical protein